MITSKFPSLPKVPDSLPGEVEIVDYLTRLRSRLVDELSIVRKALDRADSNSQTVAEDYAPDEIVGYSLPKKRIQSTGYKVTDFAPYAISTLIGSGTNNYIPKFLVGATPTFTNSSLADDGTTVTGTLPISDTVEDAATNATSTLLTFGHNTTGTAAVGFGTRFIWNLESNTTADRNAAALDVTWTTATDATRTSAIEFWNVQSGTLTPFIHSFGTDNMFWGNFAGNRTTSGTGLNVGIGRSCLYSLTTGANNLGIGALALQFCNEGYQNTAIGPSALKKLETGHENTCIGFNIANNCKAPNYNTGIGALCFNGMGNAAQRNTAVGYASLYTIGAGSYSTALGMYAGMDGAGSYNVFLGYGAGKYETGSNSLFIDNALRANEADGRIKALVYGIFNATPASQYLTVNGNFINQIYSADTNAVRNLTTFKHDTSGTAAAGFGAGILGQLQSSTTADQDAAKIAWRWRDATHASRTSEIVFSTVYGAAAIAETQMFTPSGGFAIKLTAGEDLSRGNGVYINSAGSASTVYKTPVDGDMCIGVVYADATSTNPVWVVVSGKAYVLPTSGISFALGDVIYSSTSEAGRADSAATVPAITTHMREWGHALAASGSNGALTLCVLHFN